MGKNCKTLFVKYDIYGFGGLGQQVLRKMQQDLIEHSRVLDSIKKSLEELEDFIMDLVWSVYFSIKYRPYCYK